MYCDLSDFLYSLPDEFKKLGIQCFYCNSSLVEWANVIFLCCLPSQLSNICAEIQTSLGKACIVYSFVAAVPLPRYLVRVSTGLAGLLCLLISTLAPTSWSWSFPVIRWKQLHWQKDQPAFETVSSPLFQHLWVGPFL